MPSKTANTTAKTMSPAISERLMSTMYSIRLTALMRRYSLAAWMALLNTWVSCRIASGGAGLRFAQASCAWRCKVYRTPPGLLQMSHRDTL